MKLKGVDISYYQKGIDFDKLKNEVDFVILRIGYTGYGVGKRIQEDAQFETFYAECKKINIPVGAYYYSLATSATEAVKESEFVLSKLQGKKFEYPIYWDTEEPKEMKNYHSDTPSTIGKDRLSYVGKVFLQQIERKGYYVGIYASTHWLNERLDMSKLSDFDVWVAHYGVDAPTYKGNYGMWQYSSTERLSAFDGNIDGNYAYKDYPFVIKHSNLNGYTADEQTEPSIKEELQECIDKLQSIYNKL